MAKVVRFRQAEQDLLSIAEFIARDKPIAASRWLDEIEAKFGMLAQQPFMGEAAEHIRPGLRRVSHGSYVIYYEPRDPGILIVRVLHGTRKIEDIFGRGRETET